MRYCWIVVLLGLALVADAQQMKVEYFSRLKRPLWNRAKVSVDKQQALLDFVTEENGFTFLVNGKDPVEAEEKDGFLSLKLQHKTRHITIIHPDYGQIVWRVPIKYLKKKKHYQATLLTSNSTKEYKLKQQWVVMNVEPGNVILKIDSTMRMLRDGKLQLFMPLGKHIWQAESPFFEAETGTFIVTDSAKVKLNIRLQPLYSYLSVRVEKSGMSIYLDGDSTAMKQGVSKRLMAGRHHLSLFQGNRCYYDTLFTIGESEKKIIEIGTTDLRPYPLKGQIPVLALTPDDSSDPMEKDSQQEIDVILKAADAETEIWIDREKVGSGQWHGKLSRGYHLATTVKDGIQSQSSHLFVTNNAPQEYNLAVPQTGRAMINIHSNVIGAIVYVDDEPVGETPCVISSLRSDRSTELRLLKKGYKEVRKLIKPKGNELTKVYVEMKAYN